MKNISLLGLSLLALSLSAHAATDSHRLAFSKSENVEVFIDHPAGQHWCSEQPQLRFVFTGTVSQESVARLLPKLGSLLQDQCPQAISLDWKSLDQDAHLNAQGTASKAGAWQAQIAQPAANAPTAALATTTATIAEPLASAPAPATAQLATPASATEPAVPSVTAASEPPAPPANTEPSPTPEPAAATPATTPLPVADFSVAGWKPPLSSEVLSKADFLTVLQDQQNCSLRTSYKPEVDSQFLRVESDGLRCGPDGFLDGKGKVSIKRSDGAVLKSFEGYFLHGLPLGGILPDLPIVGFDGRNNLLLMLASDPFNRVYYLARAAHDSYNGRWRMSNDIIALSENVELFRQAESVRSTVMAAVPAMEKLLPRESSFHFQAIRDLKQGLDDGNRDAWLYEVQVRKPWRASEWTFDPSHASNYLFIFERKQAEIARREAEQQVREAQRQREQRAHQAEEQLRLYQSMQEQSRNPKQLLASLIRDVGPGGGYRALMRGESSEIRQIVHIKGSSGDGWRLDYPYEARLSTGEQAGKGWYLISGRVSLDPEELDAQGLPLTLIHAQVLEACASEGCSDMGDPLKLTRQRLNAPQWTPEEAQERVRSVWPDRYPPARPQE